MNSHFFSPALWLLLAVGLAVYIGYRILRAGQLDKQDAIGLLGVVVTIYLAVSASNTAPGLTTPMVVDSTLQNSALTEKVPSITRVESVTTPQPLVSPAVAEATPTATEHVPPATVTVTATPLLTTQIPEPTSTQGEVMVVKQGIRSLPTAQATATQLSLPTNTVTPTASNTAALLPTPSMTSTVAPHPSATPTATATVLTTNGHAVIRVTAQGIGAAGENVTQPALRERTALLAAEVDAKRKLAEWLTGAEIEAVTIIEQGTLTNDVIRQVVAARIPAPRLIEQAYDSEANIATVILEIIVEDISQ